MAMDLSETAYDSLVKAQTDEKNLRYYIDDTYLKPLGSDIYYVESWFEKASWNNKLDFCERLFSVIRSTERLTELVYFIGMPGKDLIYSKEQYTKTNYDVRPVDHNRSLAADELKKVQNYFVNWFKSLRDHQQIQVFVGLLQIGGSRLAERIYTNTIQILSEQENALLLDLHAEKRIEHKKRLLKKLTARQKRKKPKDSKKNGKPPTKVVKKKFKKSAKRKSRRGRSEFEGEMESLGEAEATEEVNFEDLIQSENFAELFIKPKKDIHARYSLSNANRAWEKFVDKLKITPLKGSMLPQMDKMQMMPVWINRRIINWVPEVFYHQILSRVNPYWKAMVKQVKKEKKMRKTLNFAILKLETSAPVYRVDPLDDKKDKKKKKKNKKRNKRRGKGSPPKKLNAKKAKSTTSLKSKKRSKSSGKKKAKSASPQKKKRLLKDRPVTADADIVGFLKGEFQRSDLTEYYKPVRDCKHFQGKYYTSVVNNEYMTNRMGDASPRWIAHLANFNLKFICSVTGLPLPVDIRNCHKEKITCVAFHKNQCQVFTGSYDGTIKLFDIWSKSCKLTYMGHKGLIMSICVNKWFVVSCSTDMFVKAFRIEDAVCILSAKLDTMLTKICINELCVIYVGDIAGRLIMLKFVHKKKKSGTVVPGEIKHAHYGEITCLTTYPLLVISGGVDGFARIWDAEMVKPKWIVSFKHNTRVNAARTLFLKLFTACEDGYLYIWDMMSGDMIRKILMNTNKRAILCMNYFETDKFTKIVLFSEFDIKIIEFEMPWKRSKEKKYKHGETKINTISQVNKMAAAKDKMTITDMKMMKLHYRQAVEKSLRPGLMDKEVKGETVFSICARDKRKQVECFPRSFPDWKC